MALGPGSGPTAGAPGEALHDRDGVGPEAVDAVLDRLRGAVADGHQHDHRAHPDQDPEHGERRPQLVGHDAAQGDGEALATDHASTCPRRDRCEPGREALQGGLAVVVGDLAVAQAHDPFDVGGDIVLVGDHDHRATLGVELAEDLEDLFGGHAVEVAGGLVGQDERRVGHDRSGHRHPLLLASRQLRGHVGHAVGQADPGQRLQGPLAPGLGTHPGVDQRQLDVVQGGRPRDEVEALEDKADLPVADLGQLAVIEEPDVGAIEQVPAVSGDIETPDDVHERRLPAARRPHDGDEIPPFDGERHPPEGVDLELAHGVGLDDLAQHDDGPTVGTGLRRRHQPPALAAPKPPAPPKPHRRRRSRRRAGAPGAGRGPGPDGT